MTFKLPLFASLCGLALSVASTGQAQSIDAAPAAAAPPFTVSQTQSGPVIATASPTGVSGVAGALTVAPSAIGDLSAVTQSNTTYNQVEKGVVTSQIIAPAGSTSNSLMIDSPTGTVTLGVQAVGSQAGATGNESNVISNQSLVGATVRATNDVTVTNGAVIKDGTVAFGATFSSDSSSGNVTSNESIDSASHVSAVDNLNVINDKSNLVVAPAAYGAYASVGTASFGAGAVVNQPVTQTNAGSVSATFSGSLKGVAGYATIAPVAIGNYVATTAGK